MSCDSCVALPYDTTGLLQFVFVVFPDHTHLLFLRILKLGEFRVCSGNSFQSRTTEGKKDVL